MCVGKHNSRKQSKHFITKTQKFAGKSAPLCSTCQDNPKRKCKDCSCQVCGGKDEPDRQLMCDECDMAYHLRCLDPPLDTLPDADEW